MRRIVSRVALTMVRYIIEGRRQKAEGRRQKAMNKALGDAVTNDERKREHCNFIRNAFCLLPSVYCFLLFRVSIATL
jgi:hypothetical protein